MCMPLAKVLYTDIYALHCKQILNNIIEQGKLLCFLLVCSRSYCLIVVDINYIIVSISSTREENVERTMWPHEPTTHKCQPKSRTQRHKYRLSVASDGSAVDAVEDSWPDHSRNSMQESSCAKKLANFVRGNMFGERCAKRWVTDTTHSCKRARQCEDFAFARENKA